MYNKLYTKLVCSICTNNLELLNVGTDDYE